MDNFCDNKIQFNKLFPLPPFKNNVLENTLNERTIEKQIGKLSAYTALIPLMPYDINIDYFSADNVKGNFTGSLKASTGVIQINVNIDASIFKENTQLYLVYDFIECEVKIIDKLDNRYMVLWYISIANNKIDLGLSHNPYFNDNKIQITINEFRKELDTFFNEYNKAFNELTAKIDKVEKNFKAITDTLEYNDLSIYANRLQSVENVSSANVEEITNIKNYDKQVKNWHHDFSNTIFIGDSFADGYYAGYDPTTANDNNWCKYLADMLNITNYKKFSKGGLCFTENENSLLNLLNNVVNPNVTDKNAVTSIIMMMGVNDSVLDTNNDKIRSGANNAFGIINKNYPNATVYFFYSATQKLLEGKSYRVVAECCSNNNICFIGESYIWNNGYNTSYYVKGNNDSVYHPTTLGNTTIAKKMKNYFMIGDIISYHTSYISFEHQSTTDNPFDIHGGMYIKLNNNVLHIDIQANVFRKNDSYTNSFVTLATSIPNEVVGNSDIDLIVPTYDIVNRKNGTFSINCGNKKTILVLDNTQSFLATGVFYRANTSIDLGSWCYK